MNLVSLEETRFRFSFFFWTLYFPNEHEVMFFSVFLMVYFTIMFYLRCSRANLAHMFNVI